MRTRTKLFYLLLIVLILSTSCRSNDNGSDPIGSTYRQEMRDFVQNLSAYAKAINPDFLIIPQNGQELVTDSGQGDGIPNMDYLNAIDAVGREDLFYGYDEDDQATPSADKQHMLNLCLVCEENGVQVLTTDYCHTQSKMQNSYQLNMQNGFISFAADHRGLDNIPSYPSSPFNENSDDIVDISQAKNFLYLLDFSQFNSKQEFLSAVNSTNYDAIIMDLFFEDADFSASEIESLKTKQNGGKRLILAYMSIGEAEEYRYYWQNNWSVGNPSWIKAENPDWQGNYKVEYWNTTWQSIIYGNDNSYLKKIINAGFNGVYLDIIDAFEYFEE
ncbi:MAG: endo alpha-1,4 polygalactosaminidase [Cytophagia bacterium]|nr:endo alpha-1,4 polygalactosaminidase [Cytophagia bacterium]